MRKKEMKKLYEILVKYDDGETDLISLKFTEIEKKISQITKGGKSGKLFVIEIDTHKGTTVIINDDSVICYYDKPVLADIVLKHRNQTEILKPANMTIYVEKTIQEESF